MKAKLLSVALLATVATTALAGEFTPIFYPNTGGAIYIDKSTIKPVPSSLSDKVKSYLGGPKANVRVWEMINPPNDGSAPFGSSKSLVEINCNTRQTKFISFTSYEQANGNGRILINTSDLNDTWDYAVPGTGNDTLVTTVCK